MTKKEAFIKGLFTKPNVIFKDFEIVGISQFDENKIFILCNIDGMLNSIFYTDEYAEEIYNLYLEYDRAADTNEN